MSEPELGRRSCSCKPVLFSAISLHAGPAPNLKPEVYHTDDLAQSSRVSRRHFLKLAAVGAAAGLATPRITAAAESRQVNVIGSNSEALKSIFARAEKEIGVKVNYDVLPAKWDDVMQKITLWGQTRNSDIDVLFADDLISGLWGMNGWSEDLSGLDAWTKHSSDVVSAK